MPEALNVVALISGGKDSLFSLLHCLQNGHKIVALANLHPPGRPSKRHSDQSAEYNTILEDEDMNSFMYQTVGHQVIPLYADALGLPLYRREITGSAMQTGRYYDTSDQTLHEGDETEDLLQLLQVVLSNHPDVNAVSSGAILSTYQRTRVESVAVRLGLTPVAYLWQYPALPPSTERSDSMTGLLDDMAAAGCDARMIKIASGGIRESILWSSVIDPQTRHRLVSGLAPFFQGHEFWLRGAVLGEGGEYETLAVDGPRPVWKKRIYFDEDANSTMTREGGVHYIRLGEASLVEKETATNQEHMERFVRVPTFYDQQFEDVRERLRQPSGSYPVTQAAESSWQKIHLLMPATTTKDVASISSTHIILSNVVAEDLSLDSAAQMRAIVDQVKATLSSIDLTLGPSSAASALLLLSSMSDFSIINPVYASMFPKGLPSPPARVTVAADLPEGVKASLSLILHLGTPSQRRGLHVQSRSYWAPANIGPYSQAICEPTSFPNDESNVHDAQYVEIVHVAGQIPLLPQSMELLGDNFPEQALLGLQHLWRIGQETGVDLWPWGIAFLRYSEDASMRAQVASDIWYDIHLTPTRHDKEDELSEEEDAELDVWYARHQPSRSNDNTVNSTSIGSHLHKLPNPTALQGRRPGSEYIPTFIAAEAVSLPRNAPIEWWSLGVGNICSDSAPPLRARATTTSAPWGFFVTLTVATRNIPEPSATQRTAEITFISVCISSNAASSQDPVLDSIIDEVVPTDDPLWRNYQLVHVFAFINLQSRLQAPGAICSQKFSTCTINIPCRSLWGSVNRDNTSDRLVQPLKVAFLLRLNRHDPERESQLGLP